MVVAGTRPMELQLVDIRVLNPDAIVSRSLNCEFKLVE
jgi:hypothetical protein